MQRLVKHASIALIAVTALFVFVAAPATTGAPRSKGRAAPTPAGFDNFLVYMAEPTSGEPAFGDAEDAEEFQREVMGRSTAEIEADKSGAEEFFLQRFGLDFTATDSELFGTEESDGATFGPLVVADAFNYRSYVVSGERVPAEGWQVRDGGWIATLTEDTVLHGEYGGSEGKAVSAGAIFVFGNYNIKVERPNKEGHPDETIVIHYESGGPIIADADGVTSFICDLSHEEWGAGQARGIVTASGDVRNVLTFPPGLP